jgi:hypothetical protein
MTKWEYEVQDFYSWNQVKGDLTRMGEQGWELVCIIGTRFFFKREKRE